MADSEWERFGRHAHTNAIVARLQAVCDRMARQAKEAQRLADLAMKRSREIERGEWPYAEDNEMMISAWPKNAGEANKELWNDE